GHRGEAGRRRARRGDQLPGRGRRGRGGRRRGTPGGAPVPGGARRRHGRGRCGAHFDTVAEELGTVTGLVNNAGVTSRAGAFVDLATADLRRVVDVNLIGTVLCARRAARQMATSRGGAGGAIVNISSGAATVGSPGQYVHYAAAKAAVETLTIGLAKELAADGIRVNAVAPGVIRTEIHARETGDPDRPERAAGSVPLGRPGEPDEVAAPIEWLLSPEASYITGAILRVTGGR